MADRGRTFQLGAKGDRRSYKGAVHILGLFVDVANRELRDFCATAEVSRLSRMREYVQHLQSVGFDVTEADVKAVAGSGNIGKPHMVKAVLSKPQNVIVMESLREQMRVEAEHNPELKRAYDDMMEDSQTNIRTALFMGGDSFRPAPQTDFGTLLDYESTVKLIRQAGGLAVAAHWHLEQGKMAKADLEKLLADKQLDGLESETVNIISRRDVSKAAAETRHLGTEYGVFVIATSDSHKREDLAAFVEDRAAESTIGVTSQLIDRYHPSLRWSNLG